MSWTARHESIAAQMRERQSRGARLQLVQARRRPRPKPALKPKPKPKQWKPPAPELTIRDLENLTRIVGDKPDDAHGLCARVARWLLRDAKKWKLMVDAAKGEIGAKD